MPSLAGSLAPRLRGDKGKAATLPAMPERPPLIVAAATPLTTGGAALDEEAIWPMVRFLVERGADGVFACGTTGEGILLSTAERERAAVVFRAALRGRLIVHCGAQTTAETSRLAAHAAEIGADAVAVIPPPYFPLDAAALTEHFVAAAGACAPLPFYIYAFAARSGYPVPIEVVERVRARAPNLAGLKVSESPFEKVRALPGPGAAGLHRLGAAHPARHGARRAGRRLRARRRLPGGGARRARPARRGRRGAAAGAARRDGGAAVHRLGQARARPARRPDQAGHAPADAPAHRCRGGSPWTPPLAALEPALAVA